MRLKSFCPHLFDLIWRWLRITLVWEVTFYYTDLKESEAVFVLDGALCSPLFSNRFFSTWCARVRVVPSWKTYWCKRCRHLWFFTLAIFLSWLTCMFFPYFYVLHGFMLLHLPNLASSDHTEPRNIYVMHMFCLLHLLSCNGPRCALTTHL